MNTSFRILFVACVAVACVLSRAPASAIAASEGPTDPAELERFVDPIFAEWMDKAHCPGAAFVVVKDGALFFKKGYGVANLDTKTPFDPDTTSLRAKSVSKLFTATAVMQLAERGQVDLNADINDYLKSFKVNSPFGKPVTLANLLTHTGGFQDRGIGTTARTVSEVTPLGQYLASQLPPILYPPGERYSYSDFNTSLAGYVVESVTGVPFFQYVQDNILTPLDMQHSTMAQPQPPGVAAALATGYVWRDGAYVAKKTGYFNVYPAVAIVTTASDMAHFMIAHLEDGRYGEQHILLPPTVNQMHQHHLTIHPALRGMAYGFFEEYRNGLRVLMHQGGGDGWLNWVYLLPDQHVGLFITCNRQDNDLRLHEQVTRGFVDHYYPADQPVSAPPMAGYQQRASRYAGTYRFCRYNQAGLEKITCEEAEVTANAGGTIRLQNREWVEVEPLVFQRTDEQVAVAFEEDAAGNVARLYTPIPFDRIPWYEVKSFMFGLAGAALLVFVSALIALPASRWVRRKSPAPSSRGEKTAQWIVLGVCALNVLFFVAFIVLAIQYGALEGGGGTELDYGLPPLLAALLLVPVVSVLLTAAAAISAVVVWINGSWSIAARVHYSLVVVAAIAFAWFLDYWNLLGIRG